MTDEVLVSKKYTIIKNGKIDYDKVMNALILIKSDIEFLIEEMKKGEQRPTENRKAD